MWWENRRAGSQRLRALVRMTAPVSALPLLPATGSPRPGPSGGTAVRPASRSGAAERGAALAARLNGVQFAEGQTLVHPHRGPATVTEILDRSVNGRSRRYVRFQIHRTDPHTAVPVEKADEVAPRSVHAATRVQEPFDVLRAPPGELEEIRSRRFKANGEKLRGGDPLLTAGVVRDLTRRQEERGPSSAEKSMLKHARRPVLAELALSLSLSAGEAEELLDPAVPGERQAT